MVRTVFLATILATLHTLCRGQGLFYSTYSNPYQNSFAFATPNLKQVFTTKLSGGSNNQQLSQLQNQQLLSNILQQQTASNLPLNYQQQIIQQQQLQQQNYNLPGDVNFFGGQVQGNGLFQTAPQRFPAYEEQLRQQLAYLQLQQQQQQRDTQPLEQFQASFVPSPKDTATQVRFQNQQDEVRTQDLLGVAYSPSTKVSQVKFDSGKLKYDF